MDTLNQIPVKTLILTLFLTLGVKCNPLCEPEDYRHDCTRKVPSWIFFEGKIKDCCINLLLDECIVGAMAPKCGREKARQWMDRNHRYWFEKECISYNKRTCMGFYDRCEGLRRNITEKCKSNISPQLTGKDRRSYCCRNLEMEKCLHTPNGDDECGKYHLNVYFSVQEHKWSTECEEYTDTSACGMTGSSDGKPREPQDDFEFESIVPRKSVQTEAVKKGDIKAFNEEQVNRSAMSQTNLILVSIISCFMLIAIIIFLIYRFTPRH